MKEDSVKVFTPTLCIAVNELTQDAEMPINYNASIWLLAGTVLCLMELILPTAFVAFTMGVSAFVVALVSLIFPQLALQVLLWLGLSTTLSLLSHRFFPQRRRMTKIQDATLAETLTEIPPGKTGRVIYEGNSWRARCEDYRLGIPPNQKVYVVRREGTTLFVLPDNLLH